MLHNCSTNEGFSDAPLFANTDGAYQIVAIHAGGTDDNRVYDPYNGKGFNVAIAITPQLIENLNLYCKARNSKNVSN